MSSGFVAPTGIKKRKSAFNFSACFIGRQDSATLGQALVMHTMRALGNNLNLTQISSRMWSGKVADATMLWKSTMKHSEGTIVKAKAPTP